MDKTKSKIFLIILISFLFSSFQLIVNYNSNENIFYHIGTFISSLLIYNLFGLLPASLVKLFNRKLLTKNFLNIYLILLIIFGSLLTLGNLYNYIQRSNTNKSDTTENNSRYNLSALPEFKPSKEIPPLQKDNTYSIDGYFTAYFSGKPELTGEVDTDKFFTKSYSYTDENNLIVYNGTYDILKKEIEKRFYKKELKNYVEGQIKNLNGTLIDSKEIIHMGDICIIFSFTYATEGIGVLKYNAVILREKIFYSWAVQEIIGYSKLSAKDVFYTKLENFKIMN